jgi:hypothetical protein
LLFPRGSLVPCKWFDARDDGDTTPKKKNNLEVAFPQVLVNPATAAAVNIVRMHSLEASQY